MAVSLGDAALAGLGPSWPQSTGRPAVPAGPSEAWTTAAEEPRAPLRAVLRAVLEAYLTASSIESVGASRLWEITKGVMQRDLGERLRS
jgi:hypothetical protein